MSDPWNEWPSGKDVEHHQRPALPSMTTCSNSLVPSDRTHLAWLARSLDLRFSCTSRIDEWMAIHWTGVPDGQYRKTATGRVAWPAGLGDIFMAVTAPWVAARVAVDDRFRFGTVFLLWNLFGIADFLDASLARHGLQHGSDATSPTRTDSVLLRAVALHGAHHTAGATEEIVSPSAVAGHSVQVASSNVTV
jgi:hypothetical protein